MFKVVKTEKIREYGFVDESRKVDEDCLRSTVCHVNQNNYLVFEPQQHPNYFILHQEFTFKLDWLYRMIVDGVVTWEEQ